MNFQDAENVRNLFKEQAEVIDNLLYENNLASKTIEEQKEKLSKLLISRAKCKCEFCSNNNSFTLDDTIELFLDNSELPKLSIRAYNPMGWHKTYSKEISFCPFCGRGLL